MNITKILKAFYKKKFKNIPNNYFLAVLKYLKNNNYRIRVDYSNYYKTCEVNDNFILYESSDGEKMSGSPLSIFKNLNSNPKFKDYHHVWVLNNLDNVRVEYKDLDNVCFVKKDSKKYLKYLSECKYLINNETFPSYFIRKENQIYVNTWDDKPINALDKDAKGRNAQYKSIQRNLLQSTHIIASDKYTANSILKSYDIDTIYSGNIYDCGNPKIDLTIFANRESLLKELKLEKEKNIILYAPKGIQTDNGEIYNINQIIDNFERLKDSLSNNYHVLLKLDWFDIYDTSLLELRKYTVPDIIDTNELLSIVDILITDYSSIILDYLVTKRPILFYMPNIEEYNIDKTLHLDYKELPGPITENFNQLIENILNIKDVSNKYTNHYLNFIDKYCYNNDSNATDRAVDIIFNSNKNYSCNIVDKKVNLLFYCGGFLNNGITTSAINLLNNIDYSKYNVIVVEKGKAPFLASLCKINPNVKVIFKSGAMNLTLSEHIIRSKVYNRGFHKSNKEQSVFQEIFYREKYRLFSNSRIDVAIDFSGYVKQWSQIFAYGDFKRKVIYQHNDIVAEYYKKIDGKLKHKDNLGVIFRLYSYYDQVISVSEEVMQTNKENLKKFIDIENVAMEYVNNSINHKSILELSDKDPDDQYLKSIAFDMQTNKEKFYFVNIGRLSPEKNQKTLIYAFKELVNEYDNAILLILGDGPLYNELNDLILELNLQKNIFLLGHVDNPFSIIKKCSALVSSSNYEGQPMSLLEALVLNIPIIATDIEGNRSVLKNGYGILVKNNINEISSGMKYFIKQGYTPKRFDYLDYNSNVMQKFYNIVCRSKE